MTPLIELSDIAKHFPSAGRTLHVLKDVSLKVFPGENLAVTGPSGSGKSTLLGLMAGLERPSSGRVLHHGKPLPSGEDALAAWRRGSVGFIFQNFRLVETLTALENVMLPLEIQGSTARAATVRAQGLLRELGLAERGRHFPGQLSGGEQQRVAIARAYAHAPELILADEPTGSLDRDTAGKVLESLLRMNRAHCAALVLVTHDPAVAGRMDHALALEGGKIAHERR